MHRSKVGLIASSLMSRLVMVERQRELNPLIILRLKRRGAPEHHDQQQRSRRTRRCLALSGGECEGVKCFYFGGGELDRRLGSSLLRHSYLSHKYGEEADEKEKDADLMMHSVAMQDGYIKK